MMLRLAFTVLTLSCLGGCKEAAPELPPHVLDERYTRDTLIVEADDGRRHELTIWLATTVEQQRNGLMNIYDLPSDAGMLFVYPQPGIRSIWMKNTYIPLDLVYARADGSVSSIVHDAKPLTLASRGSSEPVKYVLELNAGAARRLNIGTDSQLIWSPPAILDGQ